MWPAKCYGVLGGSLSEITLYSGHTSALPKLRHNFPHGSARKQCLKQLFAISSLIHCTGKYLTTVDNKYEIGRIFFTKLFMQQYILRCLVEHWKWFQICGVPQVWRWRLRQRKQISCLSPPSSVKLPKTQGYIYNIQSKTGQTQTQIVFIMIF